MDRDNYCDAGVIAELCPPWWCQIAPPAAKPARMLCMSDVEKATAAERARRVKIIVFDVDGVLTDGRLFFMPTGKDANGEPTAV